jgi:transposase-like protein
MQKKSYRYSICFKQSVIESIERDGLSINEARSRYGIKGGSTIQTWMKQYGKHHLLNKVIHVSTVCLVLKKVDRLINFYLFVFLFIVYFFFYAARCTD